MNDHTINANRLEQALGWLQTLGVKVQSDITAVAGDASFRRYFRFRADNQSRILMDAPSQSADIRSFLDVTRRLRNAALHAPEVIRADQENGFLLLEDLGDRLYRDILSKDTTATCFDELFSVLVEMALLVDTSQLPEFNTRELRREMDLLPDWYLGRHRSQASREKFDLLWDEFCRCVITSARAQPQCFVHRDFHSCNLLRAPDNSVGIIDFQDAVTGPVSYDFISLLWDRYISWPRSQIEYWMEEFRLMLGLEIEPGQWQRYCDLMGLQRNVKVVGIFARLYYRDGKTGYIEMIPRFYDYILDTLRRYPEFTDMLEILEQDECAP